MTSDDRPTDRNRPGGPDDESASATGVSAGRAAQLDAADDDAARDLPPHREPAPDAMSRAIEEDEEATTRPDGAPERPEDLADGAEW